MATNSERVAEVRRGADRAATAASSAATGTSDTSDVCALLACVVDMLGELTIQVGRLADVAERGRR